MVVTGGDGLCWGASGEGVGDAVVASSSRRWRGVIGSSVAVLTAGDVGAMGKIVGDDGGGGRKGERDHCDPQDGERERLGE